MENGTFFVGRVVKINMDQTQLMDAMVNSVPTTAYKFDWAITDVEDRRTEERPYVFGKLCKFARDGQVKLVDLIKRSQVDAEAHNLAIASSPFVYIPDHSGIAYLRVWNDIQDDVFPRRFKKIVEETVGQEALGQFFAECSVEAISDYREFAIRLRELEQIKRIRARVHPPNPLFGHLWKPLKDYLAKRNASEVRINESSDAGALATDIVSLVTNTLKEAQEERPSISDNIKGAPEIGITDSALLMAADGYGSGAVIGEKNGTIVSVHTSHAQVNFLFPKEPDPYALAEEARGQLERIQRERNMEH